MAEKKHGHNILTALAGMWADGIVTREIGAALGMTRNAVIGLASRLSLPRRVAPTHGRNDPTRSGPRRPDPRPLATEFPAAGRCMWPIGHPGSQGFRFCGDELAGDGHPYCPQHNKIAYRPPTADAA
jgi:GcrA cell cycle regulator